MKPFLIYFYLRTKENLPTNIINLAVLSLLEAAAVVLQCSAVQ